MPANEESSVRPKFACEGEAALLLNCISADEYIEHKCVQYMKRLRKCVQRERIVNFELLPDSKGEEAISEQKADTSAKAETKPDQKE